MAYDRYDSRRGWREPRSRYGSETYERSSGRGFDRDDRGFWDRASDEVSSWFGDEEAERRRLQDARADRGGWDRSNWEDDRRAYMSDDDQTRFDRQARFRDEGYRRPYTGRPTGRFGFGGDRSGTDRSAHRDFSGTAYHDPHYHEWRRSQIEALDRDYDDYRRENQSRFDDDFSSWRNRRQSKRQLLGDIKEHMDVIGSDQEPVGTVDKVRGDRIILTKGDSDDGRHHMIGCSMVDRLEGDKVILDRPAAEAKRFLATDSREAGAFFRDEDRDNGPHMLNRSFSGTY